VDSFFTDTDDTTNNMRLFKCCNLTHTTHHIFTRFPQSSLGSSLLRAYSALAPKDESHFTSLNLHPSIQKALQYDFKYTEMSAVQQQVLQADAVSDLLVRAKTGTGKTLAFLIAAVEQCLAQKVCVSLLAFAAY
jgi:late competence protein required for DNA uptake (superfamily II DNA/RNA helicase)